MITSVITQDIYDLHNLYTVKNESKEKLMRIKSMAQKARFMPTNIELYRGSEFPMGVLDITGDKPDIQYGDTINISFDGELYDYQKDVLNRFYFNNDRCGLLCSPTGSGKTVLISALVSHIKRNCLILVKNISLLHQMKEELLKFTTLTDKEIGIWGDGKKEEKEITIMTQSGFIRNGTKMSGKYSTVIIDEVDCFLGDATLDVLIPFKADRMFGFTATPFTDTYPEDVLSLIFGKVTRSKYKLLTPKIKIYRYKNKEEYYQDYHMKRELLIEGDKIRTERMIDTIINESRGRSHVLVLFDRIETVVNITEREELKKIGADFIIGDVKQEERKAKIDRFKKLGGILIATESTLGRGFNVPEIDSIFIFFPNKFDGRIRQMVGRALRKKEGKAQPVIHDWYDVKFYNQYKERIKSYRELWGDSLTIKYIDV